MSVTSPEGESVKSHTFDHSVFLMEGSSHSYQRALHCFGVLRTRSDDIRALIRNFQPRYVKLLADMINTIDFCRILRWQPSRLRPPCFSTRLLIKHRIAANQQRRLDRNKAIEHQGHPRSMHPDYSPPLMIILTILAEKRERVGMWWW